MAVEDGSVRALSTRGVQRWERALEGLPSIMLPAGNSLLVGTDEQDLVKLDLEGNVLWSREDLGLITSMFWGDLDGDIQPDLAIGNRQGEVWLITDDAATTWGLLNLASEVFHVSALRRAPDQQAELIAVTDNGIVELFKSQANRPPLLIEPQTEVGEGQYSIGVSVIDVEDDPVAVTLEIWDPGLQQWNALSEKVAASGNDTLFWPVDPPEDAPEVRYRFQYDDGSHQGQVEPAPGPSAIAADQVFGSILGIALLVVVGGVGAFFLIRQNNSPAAQVRRLYQRIKQQPEATLELIEAEYIQVHGTPEFLLNLANQARKEQNRIVASLADGLYLLSAQPESSLPLILDALDSALKVDPNWRGIDHWQKVYTTGQALLTAPTITELSLQRPQLDQLLEPENGPKWHSEAFEGLLPVATTLRDSERVDLAEDRLVYLREALGMLKQMQRRSIKWPVQIENDLVEAIVNRWSGLVSAEVEDLQGRAQLVTNLLTKHLVPDKRVVVALEIGNIGRAPAENVVVELNADPAYGEISPAQVIPILSPGRNRQVHFTIAPKVTDRFRIVFTITYNDRHNEDKAIAYADMVHLLPPVQSFTPILNPYSPGMPLRRKSTVFFGRENLFNFVSQNGGSLSQRNVLILVGQRRTGKTSALLQLEEHLPKDLLPVYIDCQSLGVIPGMAALFHDLAWAISESLATKGYEVPVPQPSDWQEDPAGRFQRRFIPQVRELLPEGTVILLIFDEFEAFENLVNDGILPSTLFTYLRHLMQHGQGLSFIFGGTHRLEEMGTDYWSVLFNIALYRHIGYLSNDAAQRLIRDPVAPQIVYDDLAIDKILRVTAGHPYFLQLVCYSIVNTANARRTGYVTISDVNAALDDMLRLGEVHFAYLWQRSTQTEKALLAAASRLVEPDAPFRPEELVQFLAQYSIYLDPAEVTAGLNKLVEREIMREIADEGTSLFELRIGLVGLWVAQNKSLSRLYESRGNQTLIEQIMTPGGSD